MTELTKEKILSIVISVLTIGCYAMVTWQTHIDMLIYARNKVKRITFKDFKKIYENVEWCRETFFPNSLYCNSSGWGVNTIHADMFVINNTNYRFSVYGLFMAKRLVRKTIRETDEFYTHFNVLK